MATYKDKLKYIILVGIVVIAAFYPFRRSAYSVPAESYYAKLSTRELGNITLYVPYNMGRYFTTESNGSGLISTYSSTITCWGVNVNGTQYDIRFTYSTNPQYRQNNYSYEDLTITGIVESNIPLLSDTDFTLFSQTTIVNMMMLLVGGSILLFTMIKR